MNRPEKTALIQMHEPHWRTFWLWLALVAALGFAEALLACAWFYGWVWLMAPLVLLIAHLMHAHLIAFHEAAHGTLCPRRRWNDAVGMVIGTFSLMGFSLYRAVHWYHHAYVATERDEELWPFTVPETPLWVRRAAALAELGLGFVYTPLLFVRSFLRQGSPVRNRRLRRRIWAEFAMMICAWAVAITAIVYFQAGKFFLVLYVAPAALAGVMQSLRKYIEHMGLTGSTALGSTRSVIPTGWAGRLLALSLLNEPYHGVHHVYARLPQTALPRFASALAPTRVEHKPPFPSYRRAFLEMVANLGDPRVGAQWLGGRDTPTPDGESGTAGPPDLMHPFEHTK